jgi:hypothetical protein
MGHWIEIEPGKKRFIPTGTKPPPKTFGRAPSMTVNSVRGTQLDNMDMYGSKLMNTAPMKMKMETLRRHGKNALNRTFRK